MTNWYQMITQVKKPKLRLEIGHLQVRTSHHLLHILKTAYHVLLLLENETSDYSRLSEVMSRHIKKNKIKVFLVPAAGNSKIFVILMGWCSASSHKKSELYLVHVMGSVLFC